MIKVSTKRPYWISSDEDKPTLFYFATWCSRNLKDDNKSKVHMSNIKNTNTQFYNYGNYETPVLVTSNLDIKYVKVDAWYYYTTNYKIISNGKYIIDLELDKWATFYINVIEKMRTSNAEVYVKRSYIDNTDKLFLDDALLDKIVPTYQKGNFTLDKYLVTNLITQWTNRNNKVSVTTNKETINIINVSNNVIYMDQNTSGGEKLLNGDMYAIFYYSQQKCFYAIPVLIWTNGNSTKANVCIEFTNLLCSDAGVNVVSEKVNYLSFLGYFSGPNFYFLNNFEVKPVSFNNNTYTMMEIQTNNFMSMSSPTKINYDTQVVNQIPTTLNSNIVFHSPQIIKYEKPNFMSNSLSPKNFVYENNNAVFYLSSMYYYFVGKFMAITANSNNYNLDNIISFPDDLPSVSDTYIEFIKANKNSLDTGLSIAKQQAALGLISGVGTIGYGALTKNPLSFFGGAVVSATSIFSSINKEKQLEAKLQDAQNSAKPNFGNNTEIGLLYTQVQLPANRPDSFIVKQKLTPESIANYNNVIAKYGWVQSRYQAISSLFVYVGTTRRTFFAIDGEDFYQRNTSLFDEIPSAHLSEFIDMLTLGIRLWQGEVIYE